MANPKHVEILKRGVAAWKEWRRERPSERLDLSASNLSNLVAECSVMTGREAERRLNRPFQKYV
jgi:hypothetical protein